MIRRSLSMASIVCASVLLVAAGHPRAAAQAQQPAKPGTQGGQTVGTSGSRATASTALDESLPQEFTAIAANLSNIDVGPTTQVVEIEITRWSTDAERDRLFATLRDKGEKAALDELRDLPKVGNIRTPTSLAYDLHFARQVPWGDGGRKITLATDRYIGFAEFANQSRSLDYPFTLIDLNLNNEGQGEGSLSVATRVMATGDMLVLENLADRPIMLKNVKRQD